jgi:hypothetical protein
MHLTNWSVITELRNPRISVSPNLGRITLVLDPRSAPDGPG